MRQSTNVIDWQIANLHLLVDPKIAWHAGYHDCKANQFKTCTCSKSVVSFHQGVVSISPKQAKCCWPWKHHCMPLKHLIMVVRESHGEHDNKDAVCNDCKAKMAGRMYGSGWPA